MTHPNPELVLLNSDIRFGFHIPKLPTLQKTFESLEKTVFNCAQIYISSSRSYAPPRITPQDILESRRILSRSDNHVYVHGCLLYNLAGVVGGKDDPKFKQNRELTIRGLSSELDVAALMSPSSLCRSGVVVHSGAYVRSTRSEGIKIASETLEQALTVDTSYCTDEYLKKVGLPKEELKKKRTILLENSAGEGNKLGSTLDEMAEMINGVKSELRDQVNVCIDTAHIFAAGQYDFGTVDGIDKFYTDFDKKIGLNKLKLFHFNDSQVQYGKCVDRHENLLRGYIWGGSLNIEEVEQERVYALKKFVEEASRRNIPLVGETPGGGGELVSGLGNFANWDYAVVNQLFGMQKPLCVCCSHT